MILGRNETYNRKFSNAKRVFCNEIPLKKQQFILKERILNKLSNPFN